MDGEWPIDEREDGIQGGDVVREFSFLWLDHMVYVDEEARLRVHNNLTAAYSDIPLFWVHISTVIWLASNIILYSLFLSIGAEPILYFILLPYTLLGAWLSWKIYGPV